MRKVYKLARVPARGEKFQEDVLKDFARNTGCETHRVIITPPAQKRYPSLCSSAVQEKDVRVRVRIVAVAVGYKSRTIAGSQ